VAQTTAAKRISAIDIVFLIGSSFVGIMEFNAARRESGRIRACSVLTKYPMRREQVNGS
jgi:hypothetical protein